MAVRLYMPLKRLKNLKRTAEGSKDKALKKKYDFTS